MRETKPVSFILNFYGDALMINNNIRDPFLMIPVQNTAEIISSYNPVKIFNIPAELWIGVLIGIIISNIR